MQKPTYMVVEDEVVLLEAITKKLTINNIDVMACPSGAQAFDLLQHSPKLPDLIWLDYYLNDMDGIVFMKKIQENNMWKNIPVVVVSNSASPEKITIMQSLGVVKYILKASYRLEDIITMVQSILLNKNQQLNEQL